MGQYFHGGAPGLGMIKPSAQTGARSLAEYGAAPVCRRDRVYVVTSYAAASIYAAMHPSGMGMVYRVAPIGALEDDPDFLGDGADGVRSYQCAAACVLMSYRLKVAELNTIRRAMLS